MTDVVNKLWGFCHTLRHDGVDYGDYIEQLTYLLFLKMADERAIDVPGRDGLALPSQAVRHRAARCLHRGAADARQAARHPRRHLRWRSEPLHEPGQPRQAHRPDRRDRVDLDRHRHQGCGIRRAFWRRRPARARKGRVSTSLRGSSSRAWCGASSLTRRVQQGLRDLMTLRAAPAAS